MSHKIDLGVIGGTGIYQMEGVSIVEDLVVETPYGPPSSPIFIADVEGKTIAFLARHGIGHRIPPSEINNRANIFALKKLGIKSVVAISACGSLREDFAPGDIVIPDQIVDFTKDRVRTFFETGLVTHVSTADPFCPHLSQLLYESVVETGAKVHKGGSFVTIEGPRFSTKAESNLFRSWGMSIIGMTTSPEIFLAREAEMCYAAFAHVTDYDVWHVHEESVTVEMILKVLKKNGQIANESVLNLIKKHESYDCDCQHALASAITTHPDYVDSSQKEKLSIFINKYLQ
ncbi:MAG: S-methyl-5'-thioadenosine phosphorylase [Chloroflexi bacterium HGW-Chloroflexi-2]|jgi:5'-methylthioadenosine phosphorylase|nr:MAG: S-methyl-5'-thioadenosine phosphorylase [Chloroflexi bacterium HGW-Chloroflexi-2]